MTYCQSIVIISGLQSPLLTANAFSPFLMLITLERFRNIIAHKQEPEVGLSTENVVSSVTSMVTVRPASHFQPLLT